MIAGGEVPFSRLEMSIELSASQWRLLFRSPGTTRRRTQSLPFRAVAEELGREVAKAPRVPGVPESAPVYGCLEMGRDGFSPARLLTKLGIVAVARRLLTELWRFLEEGVVPPGALFKHEPLNG